MPELAEAAPVFIPAAKRLSWAPSAAVASGLGHTGSDVAGGLEVEASHANSEFDLSVAEVCIATAQLSATLLASLHLNSMR